MEVLVNKLDLFVWQDSQRNTFSPEKGWKQRLFGTSSASFESMPGMKLENYPNGCSSLIRYPTYRADFTGDIVELMDKNVDPKIQIVAFAVNLKSLYDYEKMPAKYESIARDAMNSLVGKVIEVNGSIGYSLASSPVTINLADIESVRKVLGIKV